MSLSHDLDPDLSALTFPPHESVEDSTPFPHQNLTRGRGRLDSISSSTTGGATSVYTDANDLSGARSSQATFRLANDGHGQGEGESESEGEGGRSFSFVDADHSFSSRRNSLSSCTPRGSRFIPEGTAAEGEEQLSERKATELASAGLAAVSTNPIIASLPHHSIPTPSTSTSTSETPRTQPNLLSQHKSIPDSSSSTSTSSIVTPTALAFSSNKGVSSNGEEEKGPRDEKNRKNEKDGKKEKGGGSEEVVEMEDPELKGLNEEQKRIVMEQM